MNQSGSWHVDTSATLLHTNLENVSTPMIQPHIRPEAPLPLLCALRVRRHGLWLSATVHWCGPLDIPGARQLIEAGHGT